MNNAAKCVSLLASLSTVSACATDPNKIGAAFVSPLKYESYDCQQIAVEQAAVEQRTNVLYHNLKGRNNSDKWMMGLGLFVAWPALLFMKGNNSAENAEFAQLKGNYDALQHAAIEQKCGLAFASDLRNVVRPTSPAAGAVSGSSVPIAAVSRASAPLALKPSQGEIPGTVHYGRVTIVPADTTSGRCIIAPENYIGTGASNMPAITDGMPRCSNLAPR
jgi:hypothetical protein